MRYADDLIPDAQEGWSWPLRFRLAHYFHRGNSLCGEEQLLEHEGEPDKIDRRPWQRCRSCQRRFERVLAWRKGAAEG